jgi:predicted N-formylglutamate amidohydrolase
MGRKQQPVRLMVTCEHGGNRVPSRYRRLFSPAVLATHRGYDPGALVMARALAARLRAPLFYSTTTRLLVDLNRDLGNPTLFSAPVKRLAIGEKMAILRRHYFPHWGAIEAWIAGQVQGGQRVLHLASHSFTPRLRGVVRTADIGLLFDPRRAGEARFCSLWKRNIEAAAPKLRVKQNYPYQGSVAGLVGHLREIFPNESYLGIELEVNQRISRREPRAWAGLRNVLIETFEQTLKK